LREQPARRAHRLRYERLLLQRLLPQPLRQRAQQRGAGEGGRGAARQLMRAAIFLMFVPAIASADAGDEVEMDPPQLKWIEPFGAIAGGMNLQSLHNPPSDHT